MNETVETPNTTEAPTLNHAFLCDLQTISGFMFFVLGCVYFCMALFLNNGFESTYLYIIFNILDIPFCIVSLLYAGSSVKLSFIENNIENSLWNGFLYGIGAILFLIVLYINFFF